MIDLSGISRVARKAHPCVKGVSDVLVAKNSLQLADLSERWCDTEPVVIPNSDGVDHQDLARYIYMCADAVNDPERRSLPMVGKVWEAALLNQYSAPGLLWRGVQITGGYATVSELTDAAVSYVNDVLDGPAVWQSFSRSRVVADVFSRGYRQLGIGAYQRPKPIVRNSRFFIVGRDLPAYHLQYGSGIILQEHSREKEALVLSEGVKIATVLSPRQSSMNAVTIVVEAQ